MCIPKSVRIATLGLLLIGCKLSTTGGAADDPPAATQPGASIGQHAVVFHAVYLGGTGSNRHDVLIFGQNFNTFSASRDDCLESADGGTWSPCDKLIRASSTDYQVTVIHGANWPHVWVKVRGPDRLFSNEALVGK